jgi:hypothetical protein
MIPGSPAEYPFHMAVATPLEVQAAGGATTLPHTLASPFACLPAFLFGD